MSETEHKSFPHKSFDNGSAHANIHPKPGYHSSLKSFALLYISCVEMKMAEPGGAQEMKCRSQIPSCTHTEHSPCLSEAKQTILSVLQPISSHGFDCHKKWEFNPYGWQGFVDWRQLWGTERLSVLYVDVSCLGREEMIKPPQVWVLHAGWKALERFHYCSSSKALHCAASLDVMHSSHQERRVVIFHT